MAIPINWWALIVTVIVSFAAGNLWFGPLFGKAWMNSMGIAMPPEMTPEVKKKMMRNMIFVIIGSFLMNFVLLHTIVFGAAYLSMSGVAAGLQAALWSWLGFIAPVTLGSVLWENRPWKYWFITAGYYLVVLVINGIILATWM
jgi:hypothetical protein